MVQGSCNNEQDTCRLIYMRFITEGSGYGWLLFANIHPEYPGFAFWFVFCTGFVLLGVFFLGGVNTKLGLFCIDHEIDDVLSKREKVLWENVCFHVV